MSEYLMFASVSEALGHVTNAESGNARFEEHPDDMAAELAGERGGFDVVLAHAPHGDSYRLVWVREE